MGVWLDHWNEWSQMYEIIIWKPKLMTPKLGLTKYEGIWTNIIWTNMN